MASSPQDITRGAQGRNLDIGHNNDDITQAMTTAAELKNLCTPVVEQTRGHVSRLRDMVNIHLKCCALPINVVPC